MFLDVEGSPPSNPSLSPDYYAGWAKLSPLIVSRRHRADLRSCPLSMPHEMTRQRGRHFNRTSLRVMPFGSRHTVPIRRTSAWDASQTTPQGAQLTCPILAWQYAGNLGSDQSLDCNLSNPSESGLMERLD